MYAIVETGGKQYQVNVGQVLDVELLSRQVGETFDLTQVLMVVDGENVQVGHPLVKGAVVKATVAGHVRGPKVRTFKYTGKRYRRRIGHRQQYTQVHIDEIATGGKES